MRKNKVRSSTCNQLYESFSRHGRQKTIELAHKNEMTVQKMCHELILEIGYKVNRLKIHRRQTLA